jgi:hypothetical protein
MPCTLQGWEVSAEEGRIKERMRQDYEFKMRALTTIACAAFKALEGQAPLPDWAREWWEQHQREDAARAATTVIDERNPHI